MGAVILYVRKLRRLWIELRQHSHTNERLLRVTGYRVTVFKECTKGLETKLHLHHAPNDCNAPLSSFTAVFTSSKFSADIAHLACF